MGLKAKSRGRHIINLDRYLEEENEEKKEKIMSLNELARRSATWQTARRGTLEKI